MSTYIITHKEYDLKIQTDSSYKTLLVGAYKDHICGDLFDDIGDNISEKNKNYCELTGLYWLWKNCDDFYIGLVHYRRFFSHSFYGNIALRNEEIIRLLDKYDIVVPFHRIYKKSIAEEYCKTSGFNKDLERVRYIIAELHSSYLEDFDAVMSGNTVFLFNMFITTKTHFNQYCEWLFSILFQLEEQLDISQYSDYQKRVFGFLAERLLNVWIRHKKLKICEVGVISTEMKMTFPIKIITGLKRSLLFKIL